MSLSLIKDGRPHAFNSPVAPLLTFLGMELSIFEHRVSSQSQNGIPRSALPSQSYDTRNAAFWVTKAATRATNKKRTTATHHRNVLMNVDNYGQ
ncbi:hypothetical protein VNO77_39659 [Canavalia gladiata]|uniref:Uncharacterized protein n=1 Tax=Canavalia gladiata TaxID=3824 RepID=A0AAN9JYY2_CANGL